MNGITLLGESHQDVVTILKELPIEVTMVCCRRTVPPTSQTGLDSLDLCDIELTEKVSGLRLMGINNGKSKWHLQFLKSFFSFIWHFISSKSVGCRKDLEVRQM